MSNRKFLIVSCVAILLCITMTSCGIVKPKTANQFIDRYNREIFDALKRHLLESEAKDFVERCSLIYNRGFDYELAEFSFRESETETKVYFAFHETISEGAIFAMIEAAILAAGDDYEKVSQRLGILSGNKYSIKGGDDKTIGFDDNTYSVKWPNEYVIFSIFIPK